MFNFFLFPLGILLLKLMNIFKDNRGIVVFSSIAVK